MRESDLDSLELELLRECWQRHGPFEPGLISQTLDPTIQENTVLSHQTAPQPNDVQTILPVLISNTRNSAFSYQQGFLIGGNVTVSYRDSYLNENAPTDVLNPSSAPSLTITFQQNLLRIVDDVVGIIKASIQLWPTLIEIAYFEKRRNGLPRTLVQNQKK